MTEKSETGLSSEKFHSDLLKGRRGLIVGVANGRSIAWGIAEALARHGAQLAFTYQSERLKENVAELTSKLSLPSPLYPCDVTQDLEIEGMVRALSADFDSLDFLVHSVAFARKEELTGRTADLSRSGFHLALDVSTYSLVALAKAAESLLEKKGGSILTLTYLGADRVFPNYNVMGVAKAGLESLVRYLAYDLGKKNIRVNALSAGPIATLAAKGISKFNDMLEEHREKSPLGRNVTLEEVGHAGLFLLSPLSSGITGEIIYADCGYRIMGI
ncbi:MAG: enoyl-ACP reductase FabI [Candidatus Omnitrophota bacterium]